MKITDIVEQVTPSAFKKKDGTPQDDQHQYKLSLVVTDPGEAEGRLLPCWTNTFLRESTKSKSITLLSLIFAVTGEKFSEDDRAKVTSDFLNSFIGSEISVMTTINEKNGSEFTKVLSILPKKK